MRTDRGPANRGTLTMIGGVLMAVIVGLAFLFDLGPENELAQRLQEAREQESRTVENRTMESRAAEPGAPFDYYLLALSWSPSFCLGRPDADQCGEGRRFVLHGLWPQNERGYPEDCFTEANRRVPGPLLDANADLTPSRGLLAYQWRKHGSCSGLSQKAFFATMRAAEAKIAVPDSLTRVAQSLRVDPKAVETAFVQANPGLSRDSVTVTCRNGDLHEVRICLDKTLEPRRCGPDVIRDCSARQIDVPAPR